MQCEILAEINDDGMTIQTKDSRAELKWSSFMKYLESRNLFVVYQSAQLMNVFPKRAFSAEQVEVFRDLLRRNLGKQ